MILRIPGIGVQSAKKIIAARKFRSLGWEHLEKIGISKTRARFFLICKEIFSAIKDLTAFQIRNQILALQHSKYQRSLSNQISLF